MGCPMKIITRAVSKDNPGGPWELVHSRTGSRIHNHEPSVDTRVHPGHRQRAAAATAVESTASLQDLVQAQTNVGISSGFVYASLTQAEPDSFVIPQDIANMKHGFRQRELSTQTVMEALFARLEAEGFYYKRESDPEPHQLREREEDYYWAMTKFQASLEEKDIDKPDWFLTDRELALIKSITEVFLGIPSLICRWHMTKNVLSKVLQVLGQVPIQDPAPGQAKFENAVETDTFMEAFYDAIDAKTEEEFDLKRVVLQNLKLYVRGQIGIGVLGSETRRLLKAHMSSAKSGFVDAVGTFTRCSCRYRPGGKRQRSQPVCWQNEMQYKHRIYSKVIVMNRHTNSGKKIARLYFGDYAVTHVRGYFERFTDDLACMSSSI
ncbi:hypothetical protein PHMEG_00010002 [Phytophthora megakarya]|uniref:MULE transposase domain-containing protein n=1 Tax=Phytophthora megakarya TaxID=4795 RepID=A0A225WES8_9STRA|nr:hypothetical protein PHMEG_00010002 [Phytophthora megakarya]